MILALEVVLCTRVKHIIVLQLCPLASPAHHILHSVVPNELADPASLHFELVALSAAHIYSVVVGTQLQIKQLFLLLSFLEPFSEKCNTIVFRE